MLEKMKNLVVEEEGQGITEYGLIVGLVVLLGAGLGTAFFDEVKNVFTALVTKLKTATSTT